MTRANYRKEKEDYFSRKDFSLVVSCELKFVKMPFVSKIEGYFPVFSKPLLHRTMDAP